MELNIDEAAVREVVSAAILEQLGNEGRGKLIQAALEYLLTPPKKDQYSRVEYPSPLQAAFNDAAAKAARQIVMETVATDPTFVAKVKEKVGEAMALVDEANYSYYVSEALAAAMGKARRDA